ncbi:tail fiber protein [Candidatus Pacearchaeota archaeon]|nr:tail fiber protein [Candidatus Pacearchaeota archaeon]
MAWTGQSFTVGQILTAAQMTNMQNDIEVSFPVGSIVGMSSSVVPTKFLETDGALYNMTTYLGLYVVIGNDYGRDAGVTFTAAITDIITANAHGKSDDDVLEVDTDGTLPAGLTADTTYYVISSTTNTFKVSLTSGGVAVDITDTGSGTHSFYDEFAVPDIRGRFMRAYSNGATIDPDKASRTDRGDGVTGDNVGTIQTDQYGSHSHVFTQVNVGVGSSSIYTTTPSRNPGANLSTSASGGNETRPENISIMFCIRY